MIYGIDWGGYVGPSHEINLPFKLLLENGLCDFFICKGAMDSYNDYVNSIQNIEAARCAGIPVVGTYYWHFPKQAVQYQIDIYSDAVDREKPDFISLDMEDSYGLSGKAVSDNAQALLIGLHNNFPKMPMFVYTSWNYIQASPPDGCGGIPNAWLKNWGRWPASWSDWSVYHSPEERRMPMSQIKTYPLPGWKPLQPLAWKDLPWHFWQFDTWQIPSGLGTLYDHQYDWNVFNGTLNDLKKLCNLDVPPVIPPVTVESLDIRLKVVEKQLGII
jgi:hypothetical protein